MINKFYIHTQSKLLDVSGTDIAATIMNKHAKVNLLAPASLGISYSGDCYVFPVLIEGLSCFSPLRVVLLRCREET